MTEHCGLAEAGKLAALRGDHVEALAYYRRAMHVAASSQASDVFLRHYLDVSLESLELSGELEAVIGWCDRALAHYEQHPPTYDVAWLDFASIRQRRGTVLLKAGRREEARVELDRAIELADRIGARLELARLLRDWTARSLFVSSDRITQEQRRLRYYSVRPDTVAGSVSALSGKEVRCAR